MSSLETNKDVFRVVIIGAGISGLAMAIGLRSAGHEVVVLERMPEFPTVSLYFLFGFENVVPDQPVTRQALVFTYPRMLARHLKALGYCPPS